MIFQSFCLKSNYEVKLYSSSGREILNLQHIKKELEYLMCEGEIFDGEIYRHGMPLNQILSIARRDVNPASNSAQLSLSYYVFDAIRINKKNETDTFAIRFADLRLRFYESAKIYMNKHVILLETILCITADEADTFYTLFIKDGYEGMMYRQKEGLYEFKRSYGIQKRKDFKEEDFIILDVEDGQGRAANLAVNVICYSPAAGESFKAPINGTEEYRTELFNNRTLWEGRYATVRFLNYSEYGIPVIPKCVAIRDQIGLD